MADIVLSDEQEIVLRLRALNKIRTPALLERIANSNANVELTAAARRQMR